MVIESIIQVNLPPMAMKASIWSGRGYGLLLVVIMVMCSSLLKLQVVDGARNISAEEEEDLEIERQLKILNKTPIETIHTEWGDILDCIDINKQPALDHPLLKDHKIQMKPSFAYSSSGDTTTATLRKSSVFKIPKEECPQGTVPIRRTTKEELVRAKLMSKSVHPRTLFGESTDIVFPGESVVGVGLEVPGETYMGSFANISLYQVNVTEDQFSSGEIAIENGSNGISAGWAVSPQLFGDHLPRVVGHWTVDGYQKTGCYNVLCAGFVQVDKTIHLGSPFDILSVYGGAQAFMSILVQQDIESKHWWLTVGLDKTRVGYWPNELFTSLKTGATALFWGGHVKAGANHISPPMGSGVMPKNLFFDSSSYRGVQYVDGSNTLRDPDPHNVVRRFECGEHYGLLDYGMSQKDRGYFFLFGGPGGQCA